MRPPITQKCLKAIDFSLKKTFKKTKFYFGGLDPQYRTPDIGFPSCKIENDNFRDSQGKEIHTKNKESFESKVLKQSNIALQLLFRRLLIRKQPVCSWSTQLR